MNKVEEQQRVLKFIDDFRCLQETPEKEETIRYQFRNGYCYYFAHMLKIAFHRGYICVCHPIGHVIWFDDLTNTAYDIEGINHSDCSDYVPLCYFGDEYKAFAHVPGELRYSTIEYIDACYQQYLADKEKGTIRYE